MSRKRKGIILSEGQLGELRQGYKSGESHGFRQRCRMILLKSEGYTAAEVASVMDSNKASVYNWLKRYEQEGIEGLRTREGQGRNPILEAEHAALVRAAVQQERQRLSQAQKIIEDNLGRKKPFYLLPATLLTSSQYHRKTLEGTESQMASSRRLRK